MFSKADLAQKQKKRDEFLAKFNSELNEPSLLHLLIFEENNKVRLSVCKALASILDYHNDKLFIIQDGKYSHLAPFSYFQ